MNVYVLPQGLYVRSSHELARELEIADASGHVWVTLHAGPSGTVCEARQWESEILRRVADALEAN